MILPVHPLWDHEVKSMLTSTMRNWIQSLMGLVCWMKKIYVLVNIQPFRQLLLLEMNVLLIDVHLSPKKALRAVMLKSRFADTILKAKQKTLLKHNLVRDFAYGGYDLLIQDHMVDPVKLQQEKERLERQQKEDKARIEAQIRAAEVASTLRAQ